MTSRRNAPRASSSSVERLDTKDQSVSSTILYEKDKRQDVDGHQLLRKEDCCGDCGAGCTSTDKVLECGLCNRKFHTSCQGVDDAMYKVIFKDSNSAAPILYWYCKPTCRKLANNFIDGLLKVQLEIEKIGQEVKGVKDKVMKIEEGEFTPKMAEAVKNIACGFGNEGQASDNAEINRNEIIRLVEEKTKEQRAEVEDRARRSKNLIIFGLPEPTSNDRNARQVEEGSSVEKLLVEVNSRHIPTETRRLGRFSTGMQKPRPLRMSFTNQANRDELLQALEERGSRSRRCETLYKDKCKKRFNTNGKERR